jgi:hypothetical protein
MAAAGLMAAVMLLMAPHLTAAVTTSFCSTHCAQHQNGNSQSTQNTTHVKSPSKCPRGGNRALNSSPETTVSQLSKFREIPPPTNSAVGIEIASPVGFID